MQLITISTAVFATVAFARDFTLYEHSNYGGASWFENRWDDNACWNLNGKGDRASSVRGQGCTTFYRERDCQGANWVNRGDAPTVPDFLNDHIWSFRNQCDGRCPNPFDSCQYEENGSCIIGYSACLQKFGCSNQAGGVDCLGIASGCRIACG